MILQPNVLIEGRQRLSIQKLRGGGGEGANAPPCSQVFSLFPYNGIFFPGTGWPEEIKCPSLLPSVFFVSIQWDIFPRNWVARGDQMPLPAPKCFLCFHTMGYFPQELGGQRRSDGAGLGFNVNTGPTNYHAGCLRLV